MFVDPDDIGCPRRVFGACVFGAFVCRLLSMCPVACAAVPVPNAQRQYLINITGSALLPDRVYLATIVAATDGVDRGKNDPDAATTTFRVADARGFRGPDIQENAKVSIQLLRRPFYSLVQVRHRGHSTDGHVRVVATLRAIEMDAYPIETHDMLAIYDNPAVLDAVWNVISIKKMQATGESLYELTLQTVRFVKLTGVPPGAGGFAFVVGISCHAPFASYSTYGITHLENDRFDLHFFNNLMLDELRMDENMQHSAEEHFDFLQSYVARAPLLLIVVLLCVDSTGVCLVSDGV